MHCKKNGLSPEEEADGEALTLLVGAGAGLHGEHTAELAWSECFHETSVQWNFIDFTRIVKIGTHSPSIHDLGAANLFRCFLGPRGMLAT